MQRPVWQTDDIILRQSSFFSTEGGLQNIHDSGTHLPRASRMSCSGFEALLLCYWGQLWRGCRRCKAGGRADVPRYDSRWTLELAPSALPAFLAHVIHGREGSIPGERSLGVKFSYLYSQMDTRVLFLHQHSESAIYLVSLQFPSDWGGGYRLPVYLRQCAVVDHNLNTVRSKQRSCGAVRIIIIYHSCQANTREIYFGWVHSQSSPEYPVTSSGSGPSP